MSFCGSAISDPSLRSIGLHLLHLKRLSVRGCVRVTSIGVEAVADGCNQLESFDVSQCKNLNPWIGKRGPSKYKDRISFETLVQNAKFRWKLFVGASKHLSSVLIKDDYCLYAAFPHSLWVYIFSTLFIPPCALWTSLSVSFCFGGKILFFVLACHDWWFYWQLC